MKLLNRSLIISFSICIAIIIGLYLSFTNQVGDLYKNNKIDDKNFKVKSHIYQYYESGAKYKGERKAIRDILITKKINLINIHNGWIVIRFVVNYLGLTDRFRFFCVDENYQKIELSNQEKENLLMILRPLHNWEVGKIESEKVDSYYQITFKVENGKVIDIF